MHPSRLVLGSPILPRLQLIRQSPAKAKPSQEALLSVHRSASLNDKPTFFIQVSSAELLTAGQAAAGPRKAGNVLANGLGLVFSLDVVSTLKNALAPRRAPRARGTRRRVSRPAPTSSNPPSLGGIRQRRSSRHTLERVLVVINHTSTTACENIQ